jgi:hypothetical protein
MTSGLEALKVKAHQRGGGVFTGWGHAHQVEGRNQWATIGTFLIVFSMFQASA